MGAVVIITLLTGNLVEAQSIRDRTRPTYTRDTPRDTTVTQTQAVELTLTLVEVRNQSLQTWLRTAATMDDSGSVLTSIVCSADAALVELGQRVRSFPPDSKSSIYQARITHIEPLLDSKDDSCVQLKATLAGKTYENSARYVMEIIIHRGVYLAIPNEAIIEEGSEQVVYVEMQTGQYMPQQIHTGLKGELYSAVMHGLESGDRVVTLGSFFIDAQHKLKANQQEAMSNAHLHH